MQTLYAFSSSLTQLLLCLQPYNLAALRVLVGSRISALEAIVTSIFPIRKVVPDIITEEARTTQVYLYVFYCRGTDAKSDHIYF